MGLPTLITTGALREPGLPVGIFPPPPLPPSLPQVRYVNPTYLSEESWPKIQERFKADGSVQLQVRTRARSASVIVVVGVVVEVGVWWLERGSGWVVQ